MMVQDTPHDDARLRLLSRLVNAVESLQRSRQNWLLKREMIHMTDKKSILFLYPVVLTTTDCLYHPRFDFLLEDMTFRNSMIRPETN